MNALLNHYGESVEKTARMPIIMNIFCGLKTEVENIWQVCMGDPTFMANITEQLQLR